ncbi:MAG: T9SS C-terminal target domain-containing protein [Sphingobacteriales bacterium]|nr:MAG: T9SS C-terminal target domain-containing protein [Sphingobacteriales bacterium]
MQKTITIRLFVAAFFLFLTGTSSTQAQGRVVINEYLPWPVNGCGVTSEFVELYNFGPGPINIGCYILTDGDFSVTIPANTILQPGQFYVIAGQNFITTGCANINNDVTVDLNWNTCNCTSGAIPTTGDGFFTDGGSASEQVVLLSPTLSVVDAVVRDLPVESSSLITTSSAGGSCASQSFDLDLMALTYETIGESAGRGNSFARRLDGDCGWVKDTQQSGGETNNTSGDNSDITASLTILQSTSCSNNGAVDILFSGSGSIFPVSYILGYDTDNDQVFESTDSYTNGTDNIGNAVGISGLAPGRYSIVLTPAAGCSNKTFNFTILDCNGTLLHCSFIDFSSNNTELNWATDFCTEIESFTIESSNNGFDFEYAGIVAVTTQAPIQNFNYKLAAGSAGFYRIRINGINGSSKYSAVLAAKKSNTAGILLKAYPNPFKNNTAMAIISNAAKDIIIEVKDIAGRIVLTQNAVLIPGINNILINIEGMPKGMYIASLSDSKLAIPIAVVKLMKE